MPDPSDAAAKHARVRCDLGRPQADRIEPLLDAIIATWNDAPMPQTNIRIDAAVAAVLVRFHVTEADMLDADQGTPPVTFRPRTR